MASDPKRAVTTPVVITPGTDIPRGEFSLKNTVLCIACTVAGNVVIKLPGGNLTVPVNVGATWIDNIEVVGIVVAGTTATAVYTALS